MLNQPDRRALVRGPVLLASIVALLLLLLAASAAAPLRNSSEVLSLSAGLGPAEVSLHLGLGRLDLRISLGAP